MKKNVLKINLSALDVLYIYTGIIYIEQRVRHAKI